MNADTATDGRLSEKKRILVLFGSPRKNGYTARLLREFLRPLEGAAEIRVIDAYEYAVAPCTGCDFCTREEGCSQNDFDELDGLIRGADFLVVATPVYVLSFPAPLKAIVDRTQRYFSARFSIGINPPVARHKTAVLLATCGSQDPEGIRVVTSQLKMIFSVMNTTLKYEIVWPNTDLEHGLSTFGPTWEQARNLALAIKSEL